MCMYTCVEMYRDVYVDMCRFLMYQHTCIMYICDLLLYWSVYTFGRENEFMYIGR